MFICKAVERGDAVASLSETNAVRWAYRQVGLPNDQRVSALATLRIFNLCNRRSRQVIGLVIFKTLYESQMRSCRSWISYINIETNSQIIKIKS